MATKVYERTISGAVSYTVPAGVSTVEIRLWGAGSGGDSGYPDTNGGGGGVSGSYVRTALVVSEGDVISGTVGVGSEHGGGIGTPQFTTVLLNGVQVAKATYADNFTWPSSGQIIEVGSYGEPGQAEAGGNGAGSPSGGGGGGGGATYGEAGGNGTNPGGGGGGGGAGDPGNAISPGIGGSGADGALEIWAVDPDDVIKSAGGNYYEPNLDANPGVETAESVITSAHFGVGNATQGTAAGGGGGYTYGDNDPSKVLTTAASHGVGSIDLSLYTLTSGIVWPAEENVSTIEAAWGPTGAEYAGQLDVPDLDDYVLKADVVAAADVRKDTPRWAGAVGVGFVGTLEPGGETQIKIVAASQYPVGTVAVGIGQI